MSSRYFCCDSCGDDFSCVGRYDDFLVSVQVEAYSSVCLWSRDFCIRGLTSLSSSLPPLRVGGSGSCVEDIARTCGQVVYMRNMLLHVAAFLVLHRLAS